MKDEGGRFASLTWVGFHFGRKIREYDRTQQWNSLEKKVFPLPGTLSPPLLLCYLANWISKKRGAQDSPIKRSLGNTLKGKVHDYLALGEVSAR